MKPAQRGAGSRYATTVFASPRLAAAVRLGDLMQHIKGGTYDTNHHPLPPERLMGQAGYWAESLSPGDFDPLARYVRAQRVHHDPTHPAERWQFDDPWEPSQGGLQACLHCTVAAHAFRHGCHAPPISRQLLSREIAETEARRAPEERHRSAVAAR